MRWRNEWEIDGVGERYRVGCERSEGVEREGEGWTGKWLRMMVEIVARRVVDERMRWQWSCVVGVVGGRVNAVGQNGYLRIGVVGGRVVG